MSNTPIEPASDEDIVRIANKKGMFNHSEILSLIARIRLLEAQAAPAEVVEPVAIYRGRCVIDCGDDGHHDIELLKLIPCDTPLYLSPNQEEAKEAGIREATMAERERCAKIAESYRGTKRGNSPVVVTGSGIARAIREERGTK